MILHPVHAVSGSIEKLIQKRTWAGWRSVCEGAAVL